MGGSNENEGENEREEEGNQESTANPDSLTSPKGYFEKVGDILLEPIFPRTMIPQSTVSRCVPAIISFLDNLLGGKVTEQNVVDYYNANYVSDPNYLLDQAGGMMTSKIPAVVLHYFNCTYKADYREALDDCCYILTNVNTSAGYHEVLIYGYDNNGNVIYMDPGTGMAYRVGADYFFNGNDRGRVTIYIEGRK